MNCCYRFYVENMSTTLANTTTAYQTLCAGPVVHALKSRWRWAEQIVSLPGRSAHAQWRFKCCCCCRLQVQSSGQVLVVTQQGPLAMYSCLRLKGFDTAAMLQGSLHAPKRCLTCDTMLLIQIPQHTTASTHPAVQCLKRV